LLDTKLDHVLLFQKIGEIDYSKVRDQLDDGRAVILNLEFEDSFANLAAIPEGHYDEELDSLARAIEADNREIWLRPLHEFNGNWYNWGVLYPGNNKSDFAPAWRYLVTFFMNRDVPVKFQLNYNRFNGENDTTPFSEVYPGDEYVDMVVITTYNRAYTDEWHQYWRTFSEEFQDAYDQVTSLTNKPIGVAEMSSTSNGGNKPEWIEEAFRSLDDDFPQVEQVTWFFYNRPVGDLTWDWDLNTDEEIEAFKHGLSLIEVR